MIFDSVKCIPPRGYVINGKIKSSLSTLSVLTERCFIGSGIIILTIIRDGMEMEGLDEEGLEREGLEGLFFV